MSADKNLRTAVRTTDSPSAHVRTLVALGVGANALTQFALQAYMSYGFAHQVWRIPTPLCAAVIVALDLFVTMFMIFTFLLRTAPLRIRAYVWSVLFFGVGAQLFAAELYARSEHWAPPVEVFASFPALFLALSLHGLIKWRQHTASTTDAPARELPVEPIKVRHEATPAEQAAGRAPVTERPPRPSKAPAAPPVPSGRDDRDVQQKARALVAEGRSCADTASIVGKSKRWVEVKTRDIRDAASREAYLQLHGPAIAGQGADLPKTDEPVDLAIGPAIATGVAGTGDKSAT